MEVKDISIKNMKTEDFKDNAYLEKYVEELRQGGVNVVVKARQEGLLRKLRQ